MAYAKNRIPEKPEGPPTSNKEDSLLPNIYVGTNVLDLPEPEWLLEDFIQEQGITVVASEPGDGKSLIMQSWANTLASKPRLSWVGRYRKKQTNVLYVMAEGQGGIRARMLAWAASKGLAMDPVEHKPVGMPEVHWMMEPVYLWSDPTRQEFNEDQKELIEYVREHEIGVVFLDTLAATFGGGSENSQQDMNQYMKVVRAFRKEGAATVIAHHLARAGNIRGSTVLPGDADTIVYLEAEKEDELIQWVEVRCGKQKDGKPFSKFNLLPKEHKVESLRGEHITLEYDSSFQPTKGPNAKRDRDKDAEVAILSILNSGEMKWTPLRAMIRGDKERLAEARERLKNAGAIYQDEDGYWRTS